MSNGPARRQLAIPTLPAYPWTNASYRRGETVVRRRKKPPQSAEDIHREMLEFLDEHPPAHRPEPSGSGKDRRRRPTSPAPRPTRPELMLRRLRYEVALERLEKFLRHHHERGTAEVRVIHGKGLRSGEGGPVLGEAVRNFCAAHPQWVRSTRVASAHEGGEGALIVEIRPPE